VVGDDEALLAVQLDDEVPSRVEVKPTVGEGVVQLFV
jgi:hypothetical protein